jgi:replicative DNA helicase
VADRSSSSRDSSSGGLHRVPPHNLEAERSLLGAMLLRTDAVAAAVEIVNADDFFKPAHANVFDAVTNLYSQGAPIDAVTVAEELRRASLLDSVGGLPFLYDVQASTPAISNAGHYARIVEENALLRNLISVAGEIAEIGYGLPDDVAKAIDHAESMVFQIADKRVADTTRSLHELLGGTLDHLESLFERGESITGLPTGYNDLDELLSGLQPSTLNIVGARPSMGKCVAWDTPILDPTSGAVVTIAEVYKQGASDEPVDIAALSDNGMVVASSPTNFVDDGFKPVFRVRTALGREVRTTGSHPFLTEKGWRPLMELEVGASIAVPAQLPFFGIDKMVGAEVTVLAHCLGTLGLAGAGDRALADAVNRCHELGVDVIATLKEHGLWHVDPLTAQLPSALYRLPREQIELFLERLSMANRIVRSSPPVCFVTRSYALAQAVMHLKLRLGVVTRCRPATVRVAGELLDVFELSEVDGRALLARRPSPDVLWDVIDSIESDGQDQVYDLTVAQHHNFVAADVFVHNTAFALGMATHAAVDRRKPVLFFSLEMGHRELTQRILASEARVDSQKMRTGKLTEQDWTKISKALGRLESPLWIDDNPNLTVMEIRAKARRLKSRVGELGLIVVDYLQLMSGRGNAENRQVEVSEMSRGLKILARELEVPIVALSQLSRGLELRADKRPMLADLRESGSIEQDADVVMFLYRDEIYNPESSDIGTAEVIVAKHRNGPTGSKKLAFIGTYTKFANIARGM